MHKYNNSNQKDHDDCRYWCWCWCWVFGALRHRSKRTRQIVVVVGVCSLAPFPSPLFLTFLAFLLPSLLHNGTSPFIPFSIFLFLFSFFLFSLSRNPSSWMTGTTSTRFSS